MWCLKQRNRCDHQRRVGSVAMAPRLDRSGIFAASWWRPAGGVKSWSSPCCGAWILSPWVTWLVTFLQKQQLFFAFWIKSKHLRRLKGSLLVAPDHFLLWQIGVLLFGVGGWPKSFGDHEGVCWNRKMQWYISVYASTVWKGCRYLRSQTHRQNGGWTHVIPNPQKMTVAF